MQNILAFLKGKRTYFCAALLFVLGGCKALGWIDEATFASLSAIIGGLGLAALRASNAK